MAANEYYNQGSDLPFYHYSQQHNLGPWPPPPSPYHSSDTFPSHPTAYVGAGKPQHEPLIYEYQAGPTRRRGLFSSFPDFIYNWWLCILSLFMSCAATAAIFVLLLLVDGQTIPKLPLSITVNTYVSFFATIVKGTMLVAVNESISQLKWLWFRQPRTLQDIQVFDDASRGPVGALRLIFRTKGASLVALGSLVAVFSLVMDPFAQQIVSYRTRSVDTHPASVGRAQSYDAGLLLSSSKSFELHHPCS